MDLLLWGGLSKMFEIILSGLLDIFGAELLIGMMFVFSFIFMILSRGAGITAALGTFFFAVYLFANNEMASTFLIGQEWYITIVILFGLLVGFLVYMFFLR